MLDKNKKQAYIMKIVFFILITVAAIMVCYLLCMNYFKSNAKEAEVIIIKEESFLSEFKVIDNEVHIYCTVSLKNNSSDMKRVKLAGNFQEEVKNGLLKEDSLDAYFIKDAVNSVAVEGNSNIKYIEVEFVGEYAGNSSMSSRMLPDIKVMELYTEYQYPNEEFFGKELYSEIDYQCSDDESQIGNMMVNKAIDVSEYSGTKEDSESTMGDVGALDRYYLYDRKEAASQKATFEFITCKIMEEMGRIWVVTKRIYYDSDGKMIGGSSGILTLWNIENKEGEWKVVEIREAP